MASLMENLIDTLEQECIEYEGLLTLSRKKTPIIVKGDLEELQKITDDEQESVSRISRLEKRRQDVTADIANVLNKDVTSLKLAQLIDLLSNRPAESQKLAAAHDKLQEVVHALQQVNEQNRELLINALDMVSFEMNLLQASKAAPETANYSRSAYNTGDVMGVFGGGFDAKQ